jgi:hypothetical protein
VDTRRGHRFDARCGLEGVSPIAIAGYLAIGPMLSRQQGANSMYTRCSSACAHSARATASPNAGLCCKLLVSLSSMHVVIVGSVIRHVALYSLLPLRGVGWIKLVCIPIRR